MSKQAILDRLVTAYREADADFDTAQKGKQEHKAFEFARIIGKLQGEMQNVALELGLQEPMRIAPVAA